MESGANRAMRDRDVADKVAATVERQTGSGVGMLAKGIEGAAREPRWDECGLEQKVDRLRMVLRMVSERSLVAQRIAAEAHSTARNHEHGRQGVVMPVNDERGYARTAGSPLSDQDWFARLLD